MSRVVRMLLVCALCALGWGAMAGSASAGIWTEVASNTTENITAIDYQGGDRFWIATGGGKILYREGGVFKPAAGLLGSFPFNDVAFQPGTDIGLAVGNSNNVWRSTNGGRNWTKLTVNTIVNDNCNAVAGTPTPVVDLYTVAWGANNVVYLGGDHNTVVRSSDSGANFTEVNKTTAGCRIDNSISDIAFLPGSTSRNDERLLFQAREAFGKLYESTDGLQSTAIPRDETINGTQTNTNLAVDLTNTNRIWATNECGFTCLYRSEDGGSNFNCVCTIQNEGSENQVAWFDIEHAGGTIIAAGRAGQIVNSADGVNFYYNKADGALATKDWMSVAIASGTEAAVGGQGGALVVSGAANTIPDIIKPTGVIVGPTTDQAGRPLTFTAQVADTGGSGIDPNGFAWTSAGLPGAAGQTATLTFPNPGFFTVRVAFRDLAGNTAEATLGVSIGKAPTGGASLPVSFSGPGNSLGAKIVGKRVRVRARGTIVPPAGTSLAAACKGKVKLTVKKKRKTLATRKAKLKLKGGRCRFGKTIFIKRSKVGRNTTRLRLKISFKGNAALAAGQTTKTLVIKR